MNRPKFVTAMDQARREVRLRWSDLADRWSDNHKRQFQGEFVDPSLRGTDIFIRDLESLEDTIATIHRTLDK